MTRIHPLAVLGDIDFGALLHADPLLWRQDTGPAPEPPPARRDRGAAVRIEHVGKAFPGGARALDGISLSIAAGSIFGIIGRSGAGKSTLLRCINRLETPDRGRITVGGEPVTELADHDLPGLRRRVGMIFQHFNLLSAKTVFENVALPLVLADERPAIIRHRVETLLDLVGLADKRDVYPAKLSGGQKQRVGIARALVHEPEVLLCDEATSALDPETTRQILALLQDINRRLGPTVILITHEMGVVREICDRVAVLEAGRVVEEGEVWEVFARPRADATRRLLAALAPPVPRALEARLVDAGDPAGSDAVVAVGIVDRGEGDPLLADLARETDARFRVLHGGIEEIQGRRIGRLVLAIPDQPAGALPAALRFLAARAENVEVLGHVRGAL